MGFFDLAAVYVGGGAYAFAICGLLYLGGSVVAHFFDIDRFVAGVVSVFVGLVIVIGPDAWQLIARWWVESSPDILTYHAEMEMTNGQIGTLILWKLIAGLAAGVGSGALMRRLDLD